MTSFGAKEGVGAVSSGIAEFIVETLLVVAVISVIAVAAKLLKKRR